MNGVGIVIVVLGSVALAGIMCWFVVSTALRRSRSGARHGRRR